MNNFLIFPIIIPFFFAIILIFLRTNILVQRAFTLIALATSSVCAFLLMLEVKNEGIQMVTFGDWPAQFGITMVADGVSTLLVLSTSILAFFIVWFGFPIIGEGREKHFYYSGILMITTGVNGAFTTGDIFNLFVFFEVLLISSYLLIVIGGEKAQLKESMKYIIVNVISSSLFVITVAFLYSVIGTLNMADISHKIAGVNQPGIITTIGIMFLMVFGLKAAIFPLYFWLPSSYSAAPTPVLALFGALLTKVGVYAIMRTYSLFFSHDTSYTFEVLLILSIITIIAGSIGALAHFDVKQIIIYNIVIAIGVILFGVAQASETGYLGAMFYLVHDMIIKAALFMLIGIIIIVTGTSNLRKMGGLMKTRPVLGWLYLVAAFGLIGIPPLSGFIGKLFILKSGFEQENIVTTLIVLASSIVVLLSAIRIFIYTFWGEQKETAAVDEVQYKKIMIPTAILVLISVLFGVGAEWITPFMQQAANVLTDPSIYVDAVLKGGK